MKSSARWLGPVAIAAMLGATARGAGESRARPGRALIVVGLPGDAAHEELFRATAARWKGWLAGRLGFPEGEVRILSGASADPGKAEAPATRESIAREADSLRKRAGADDRVWVFVLGHASLDDGHASLHLPGPDLRDDEFAALFRGLNAREQVFWMTTSGSGAFLPPLSSPGRVVIAATERSGEFNETEFPHALAEVVSGPPDRLDQDKDGKVSVFEVFLATCRAVEARFKAADALPTEHAQLDDDGDGVGTEPKADRKPTDPDGSLASKTFLPLAGPKSDPKPPPRSDHGTERPAPAQPPR